MWWWRDNGGGDGGDGGDRDGGDDMMTELMVTMDGINTHVVCTSPLNLALGAVLSPTVRHPCLCPTSGRRGRPPSVRGTARWLALCPKTTQRTRLCYRVRSWRMHRNDVTLHRAKKKKSNWSLPKRVGTWALGIVWRDRISKNSKQKFQAKMRHH